ncbi:MAG: hypothetical protein V4448_17600 [Pseudomonadota bacterium]
MEKPVLGHIDCPACGAPQGMRFIHDKNGKPFGHCDDCNGQLRIGGNGYREKKFAALHPWASAKPAEIPVTVTETKTAEVAPVAPVQVSVPTPKIEAPIKPRSSFVDAVAFLSGGNNGAR